MGWGDPKGSSTNKLAHSVKRFLNSGTTKDRELMAEALAQYENTSSLVPPPPLAY